MRSKVTRKRGARTRDRWYSTLSLAGVAVMMLVLAGCDGGGGSSDSARANVGISKFAGIVPRNDALLCGDPVVELLIAGQEHEAGTVTISNYVEGGESYLNITIETQGTWVMQSTHVDVGSSATDYEQNSQGIPQPGQFPYKHERADGEYVTIDEFQIPLTTECGLDIYIFVHAEVFEGVDDDGNGVGGETAWGGENPGSGPRWFFYIKYTVQCCEDDPGDDGEFRTQTQGGWGTICHGENPGCYRDEWFEVAFPNGIELGCDSGFTALFTSSEAVQNFLPSGGKSGALTGNLVDPTGNTSAGVLLGQLLAAELSVAFDMVDPDFSESDDLLIDLVLCDTGTAADGLTVGQILDEANLIVGGCTGTTGLSAAAVSDALAAINENFVDGDTDLGHLCAP